MRIDNLTVELGQNLTPGSFAIRVSDSKPIFVTKIAPVEAKSERFYVDLDGDFAWRIQRLDELFDYPCLVPNDWHIEVDLLEGEELGAVQPPDRIGSVYLTTDGRGFYGVLPMGSPRAFGLGGEHAAVPTEGVVFRRWKIVSGSGNEAKELFERSV